MVSNTLSTNQYITIDFADWSINPATQGDIICNYQVGTNYYWVPAVLEYVSDNIYKFGVYNNQSIYAIPYGQLITLRIDHLNPDAYHGVLITGTQWNYLKITAHASDQSILEHQYAEVWVEPYEHISLEVEPALTYINAVSIY